MNWRDARQVIDNENLDISLTHFLLKKMILDYIKQYGFATKTNIDHLILDILPAVLDENQKVNKVRNLKYAFNK